VFCLELVDALCGEMVSCQTFDAFQMGFSDQGETGGGEISAGVFVDGGGFFLPDVWEDMPNVVSGMDMNHGYESLMNHESDPFFIFRGK